MPFFQYARFRHFLVEKGRAEKVCNLIGNTGRGHPTKSK